MPPWDTKISGTPTSGTKPTAEAMLKNDCPGDEDGEPHDQQAAKRIGRTRGYAQTKQREACIQHHECHAADETEFSPATAKIESPMGSGR